MKNGEDYWKGLSFDERIQILDDGDFFNGFANHLWEYLPVLVQIYIGRREKEKNDYEG